jgi:hypothetical protein
MNTLVMDKVMQQMQTLPSELQWRVLEFTRALAISTPRGIPGRQLLDLAGSVPLADLEQMSQAIEEGCEQVDAHDW